MKRWLTFSVALFALLPFSDTAIADGDEPPLFVTADGTDSGDCRDPGSGCQTISYALTQVGKNGQIRVGDGSFEVSSVADVVYMLSGAIDVRGSNSAGSKSTLIGVPSEFAGQLQAKGFTVIADSKGLQNESVVSQLSLQSNTAATVCAAGLAGVFPCSNIDLLAHIADRTPAARGADIWGFMDLNTHREYAIVGYSSGTAVYDVTNPENSREVGFINGQSTTWRDIKVYQFWNAADGRWNAFAYITADNATDGLFIIDLNQLPQRIARVSYASDFAAAHNVYLTDADFSTGLSLSGGMPNLILAGADRSDGRFRSYTLADPAAPAFVNTPATPPDQPGGNRLYMHDAASMVVTDSRKDTQCVNATEIDHCDVLFDFNESSIDVWDITLANMPVRLSQVPYSNARYTHSGWPSEDQQYLFVQDELDERDRGLATTLRVFSIDDLTSPTLAGSWTGPTNAIDHNGFVRGNRYYMSNYARGLTVLDITNAAAPTLAGRFDTYPASDGVGFPGNWGVYPFLPSGNIALSDIDSGFYMVADKTLDVTQGTLRFSSAAFGATEGQPLNIQVQRANGSQGAITVRWELIAATAQAEDVAVASGTLGWADGDASTQTIDLGPVVDADDEGLELLIVRLAAPTGGATLGAPSLATAYIGDIGAAPSVAFATANAAVAERGFATAIVVVQRTGSATGTLSVNYDVSDGSATYGSDYTGPAAGTLTWADGDANPKWIEFSITDDGSTEPDEFFELTLADVSVGSIGSNNRYRVNILDGTGANSAPNSNAGASQRVRGGEVVTLDGSASNDPNGDALTYSWTQTLGPDVSLSTPSAAAATFTAPNVNSDTMLRFELTVADTSGLSDTSVANVTVTAGSGGASSSGGGATGTWMLLVLAGFALVVTRRDASLLSFARDRGPSK